MSGPKKYLRTESGERIDQPDFEHAAEESQLAGLTQLGETFIVGSDAGQKNYVLSGFKVTNPSANNLEISIGSGILSWKDQGNVEHGVMIDMTTARTVGLSTTLAGAGATTYGVYVSFNLQDAQQENRNFWNALVATPVEVTRQIATRRVDSLEVNIKTSSPGTEWMHIADIVPGSLVPAVGSTTGITDKRVFYFEGAVANTYSPTDDWGTSNDRNLDRATYGLKGLRQFARAVQAQLKGLTGTRWFSEITSEQSVNSLETNKLDNRGAGAPTVSRGRMYGDLNPFTDNATDLGDNTTPRRWADIHAGSIWLGLGRLTAALADDPRIVIKAAAGSLSTKILTSIIDSITPDGTTIEIIRVPPVSADLQLPGGLYGTLAIAVNCYYDNTVASPISVWKRYDNAKHSYLLELGTAAGDGGGMRLWFHHEASDNVWHNTGTGTVADWTLYFGAGMRGQTVGTTTGAAKNAVVTGQVELPTGGLTAAGVVTGSSIVAGTCTLARHVGYIDIATGGGSVTRGEINGTFSAALSGTNAVRVTLTDAFSGIDTYAISATMTGYFPSGTTYLSGPMALPVGAGIFDIYFTDQLGAKWNLSNVAATAAVRVYIMTFGS